MSTASKSLTKISDSMKLTTKSISNSYVKYAVDCDDKMDNTCYETSRINSMLVNLRSTPLNMAASTCLEIIKKILSQRFLVEYLSLSRKIHRDSKLVTADLNVDMESNNGLNASTQSKKYIHSLHNWGWEFHQSPQTS